MSAVVSTHDRQAIEEFVVEQIEAAGVDPEMISPDATLESLGLDSLDVVELSQGVKKDLGIPVSPKDFFDARTVSQAVSVICRRAGLE